MDPKSFKKLQRHWYGLLKQEGFEDIEDTDVTGIPLKEWHSFKFTSERIQARRERVTEYQDRAEIFLNSQNLDEICQIVVNHGNCQFDRNQIKLIWEMHCAGDTQREIAKRIKCSKSPVHYVLRKIREWMKLL